MKRISRLEWVDHFKRFAESGMSVTEYTKKHGLAPSRWYYWRKLLGLPRDEVKAFIPVIAKDGGSTAKLSVSLGKELSLSFSEDVNLARLSSIVKSLLGSLR